VAKDTKPFLIDFGFSHPHDTRDGTPELLAKYGATNHTDKASLPSLHSLQPPLPSNHLLKHPFNNSDMNVRDEVAVSGVWGNRDEASIRNEIGRQYACSDNIDIQIGRVLKKLEETGELDNTYIIYTADHGIAIGHHGLMGKQNLYQHCWRVPFIVKGPGIAAGRRVEGNIYLLDLLATFCDLAGIQPPETNEGTSFKPVLTGEKQAMRETLYGVYAGGAKPGMRSVKQGDWKLIQYESADGTSKHTQLFNLTENPDELLPEHGKLNLADDPKHAEKLAEMKKLLLSEMRRLDDPWRFADQPNDNLPVPPAPVKKAKKTKKK
jgi:arylsulfatase A-like enzyme